jgi:hypothetical protein
MRYRIRPTLPVTLPTANVAPTVAAALKPATSADAGRVDEGDQTEIDDHGRWPPLRRGVSDRRLEARRAGYVQVPAHHDDGHTVASPLRGDRYLHGCRAAPCRLRHVRCGHVHVRSG